MAAQQLGRQAIGFEIDRERADFAARRLPPPNRVMVDDARHVTRYALPPFELLFSSPPDTSFRAWDEAGTAVHAEDLHQLFASVAGVVRPRGKVVLEMSNVREGPRVRTVAWDAARVLANLFHFEGEQVRCNTGAEPAGPGFDHSYLLVFTHERP